MWFLARIYIPIGVTVLVGMLSGWALAQPFAQRRWGPALPHRVPATLGQFLFWIGVPAGIVYFLQQADLAKGVLLAPVVAWAAMLGALGCSWLWLRSRRRLWSRPAIGAFSLTATLGNTGYIGYPIILLLPQLGPNYFGWALFYDVLGTLFGAYGLGVLIAARFGGRPSKVSSSRPWMASLRELSKTPAILAFFLGLALRPVPFPHWLNLGLGSFAWLVVMLSLVLIGMRLQQLNSWDKLVPGMASLSIRMVLTPLVVGLVLTLLGIVGPPRLVLVLQAGMPSAFASIVLAETYDLDRELTVTCVAMSSTALLLTLPLWLWGFPP